MHFTNPSLKALLSYVVFAQSGFVNMLKVSARPRGLRPSKKTDDDG
nr:hypothetical protein NCPCFENI_01365 [Cupriavidus sp.]